MNYLQQTKHALGSEAQLTLVTSDQDNAAQLLDELWDRIDRFEAKFSRFRAASELSTVNAAAGKRTDVSDAFIRLLRTSIDYSRTTDGLFNPLTLPQLQQAGYIGSWPAPGNFNKDLDYRQRQVANPADIQLGDHWIVLPGNSALDFGGCGKGYLLDALSVYLDSQPLGGYCLSLGGDIICTGLSPQGTPWQIGLQHASQPAHDIRTLVLGGPAKQAMATSGTTKRRGKGWNHLIDPRTNVPTTSTILSATVVDTSALAADIYAKCLVLVGQDKAKEWATQRAITQAVLQCQVNGDTKIIEWGPDND